MTLERQGHIVELQSLRGLAALAVVAGHTFSMFVQPYWLERLYLIFNGRGAVSLFFVLSGFVLVLSLKKSKNDFPSLVSYWIRRGFRIYPAIWAIGAAALIYVMFIHQQLPAPDGLSLYFLDRYGPERLSFIYIAASFGGALAYLIPPLWSIFVELVISFFIPFMAFLAWRKRGWFHLAFVLSIAMAFVIGRETYYHVGLYGAAFFIGAWLATLGPAAKKQIAKLKPISGLGVLVLAVALAGSRYLPLDYYHPVAALYEAVLAAGIIALIVYGGANAPVLRSKVMSWLGDISYSVYLSHYLVASLMIKFMYQFEIIVGYQLGAVYRGILLTLLTILITLPLSAACYRFVEIPGISLGRAVSRFAGRFVGGGTNIEVNVTPP